MKTEKLFFIILFISMYANCVIAEVQFSDTFNAYKSGWEPNGSSALRDCTRTDGASCTTWNASNIPIGWTGYSVDSGGSLSIVPDGGYNDTPCLKVVYPAGTAQTKITMIKWLGNDLSSRDIYIGWRVKYEDEGSEKWHWSNGFVKMGRYYQGVDLNNLKQDYMTGSWSVQPRNYPNYIIPDIGNAGEYSNHTIDPNPYVAGMWNVDVGIADTGHWRPFRAWHAYGKGLDPKTALRNNFGDIDDNTGYFTTPQTWHTVEWHLRLRIIEETGDTYPAAKVSDWSLSIAGNHTSDFPVNTEVQCNGSGQSPAMWPYGSNVNVPVIHIVKSSSYSNGKTILTFQEQSNDRRGPFLTEQLTSIVKIIETSPGLIEIITDGIKSDMPLNPLNDASIPNATRYGAFNYISFCDNQNLTKPHKITKYLDDCVISTTPIDWNNVTDILSVGSPPKVPSKRDLTIKE